MLKTGDHARDQARAQLDHILLLEADLQKCEPGNAYDEALQAIEESPLEVTVRGGWHSVGTQERLNEPEEFCILLCTGGPAVRIIGTLGKWCEPDSCKLQYQDWGTPWTDYQLDTEQHDKVLAYCSHFYFGEG